MKILLILLVAVLVSGCSAIGENTLTDIHGNTTNKHGMLIAGVVEDNKNRMVYRQPTLRLVAQPGESMILGNVAVLEVYGDLPELAAVESYVSPGYQLTRDLATTVLFPLMSWGIIREVMPWTQPLIVEQPPAQIITQPPAQIITQPPPLVVRP